MLDASFVSFIGVKTKRSIQIRSMVFMVLIATRPATISVGCAKEYTLTRRPSTHRLLSMCQRFQSEGGCVDQPRELVVYQRRLSQLVRLKCARERDWKAVYKRRINLGEKLTSYGWVRGEVPQEMEA